MILTLFNSRLQPMKLSERTNRSSGQNARRDRLASQCAFCPTVKLEFAREKRYLQPDQCRYVWLEIILAS